MIRRANILKFSVVLWGLMLLAIGLTFRVRELDNFPDMDWLIATQLLLSLTAIFVGMYLIRSNLNFGFGTKLLFAYIAIAFIANFFSVSITLSFGYWILLTGASLLTIGIVLSLNEIGESKTIEKVWFYVVSLTVILNAIISYLNPTLTRNVDYARLGGGWTDASSLAYLACFAFIMAFNKEIKNQFLLNVFKIIFIIIILLTKTRVPLFICLTVLLFHLSYKSKKFIPPLIFIPCLSGLIITGVALIICTNYDLLKLFQEWFIRNDINNVLTFSKRTEIWSLVINILFNDPLRLFWGYGYGLTKFILYSHLKRAAFIPFHTHNAFLEHLLSMGFLQTFIFVIMVAYSNAWVLFFKRFNTPDHSDFVIRAATVIIAFDISLLFGIPMGGKLLPYSLLYIFYLVLLDKNFIATINKNE